MTAAPSGASAAASRAVMSGFLGVSIYPRTESVCFVGYFRGTNNIDLHTELNKVDVPPLCAAFIERRIG